MSQEQKSTSANPIGGSDGFSLQHTQIYEKSLKVSGSLTLGGFFDIETEVRRKTSLAMESDEEFINKTQLLIKQLPQRLQAGATALLERVGPVEQVRVKELTYIPVFHLRPPMDQSSVINRFRRDIFKILSEEAQGSTLITVGEESSRSFDSPSLHRAMAARINIWKQEGTVPSGARTDNIHINFDAYYYAIFDHMKKHPFVKVVGVDSSDIDGLMALNTFSPNRIGSYALTEEVEDRILIEARTRYALHQVAKLAKSDDKVIFIQGAAHALGVETWCHRNQIDIRVRMAPFFG